MKTAKHCFAVCPVLQLDVQYVFNPGTDPTIRGAFVVGLRFEIGLRFALIEV
jgi:carbohydrate-selective porin OprB